MENKIKTETAPIYGNTTSNREEEIIQQALAILDSRLKTNPIEMTSYNAVKNYCRLNLASLEHEVFSILFLNNQNVLIERVEMFRGTIDNASVYPREVVKAALQLNAAAVIFAHNHPSGLSEPSQADKNVTSKLKQALELLDIRTLDHIIIGDTTYSFAEHGLI